MKKIFILVATLIIGSKVYAQDETVKGLKDESAKTIQKDAGDTSSKTWKKGGLFSINVSQGSLKNWAAGGDKFSMSLNLYTNFFTFYKKGKNSWDNNIDFYLGYVNTTTLGARKNDDRIDITSKYGYALNPKLNLSTLFNFRSQFFAGYEYPNANTENLTSNILAPAYILLGVGLDYKPTSDLSIFFSPLTTRWVIVNDKTLSAKGLYGVEPGKKSATQIGAYASINYTKNLNQIITYKGRLDLFSNYKSNPQNIDLFMTNMFSAKLSKILSATWSLDLIYDDDVKLFGKNSNSPNLQLKSLLGVGLLVKL
ncbi:MAG: DUF3078 domain-containing protein [Chitinophagaceae bacterium]|nr:DUF3078 domain-containing protein [Chitinophagaceae bacterium]MCW5904997.1 DUF3078 domain-containing protein [Chitinophagaceae bacterium]